eukprot:CAMPEP_0119552518 /NCGR_PEP_ID=MMETSP1352-20130426/5477_1 /TAXON_ID=265584 /ORGANISM="Stauroneis constricta, Strain CCMP1120" /LENGTH=603 /DNA_ID=CAMNT_0007598759 /DNA_START=265 /DNA_END=2076 /DNA_ORIENTATION=-
MADFNSSDTGYAAGDGSPFGSILSELPFAAKVVLVYVSAFIFVGVIGQDSGPGLSKEFPLQFRILASMRTPMLMFIVVPLSFAKWMYQTYIVDAFREYQRRNVSAMDGHADRCQLIVDQVMEWNKAGRKQLMRTARPNWASMSTKLSSNKEACHRISTAHLNHILDIDEENMTITCEPGVTMGMITHKLLPRNLALRCQIEMESITIGGVASGFGLETNSHKFGFFQETVLEYKLVTSDGKLVTCTAESNPDLFYALPWSHGSLGFLVSLKVQLLRIKPFVKITYIPTYTAEELQTKIRAYAEADDDDDDEGNVNAPDFVEATIYTKDKAVIQLGKFVDAPTTPEERKRINGINYFWKPFYYKWVETFLTKGESWEIAPTKHFYHRFTRSIFWELEDMIPFSNHPIYRCLWGWMGAPEVSLLKLFQGPVIRQNSVNAHVVQESIMPISKLSEGIDKFDDWFGVYPLLVFCIRIYGRGKHSGFLTPQDKYLKPKKDWGIWVDLGAYGVPRLVKEGKSSWNPKTNIREMEHWTRDVSGWQATYTDLFATKKEFRQMFNHTLYDEQRAKYNALDAFPEVYDKVKPEAGVVDLSDVVAAEEASKKNK